MTKIDVFLRFDSWWGYKHQVVQGSELRGYKERCSAVPHSGRK